MNQDQLQILIDQITSYSLDGISALVILLVGWWIAGRAHFLVRRALDRVPRIDDTLKPFLSSTVRYFVIVITVVAVLAEFGVQTTSIIAVLGAAGLAIGLALQGTLQNIAAGIMLLILRPFRVGEYIDAGGVAGTVDAINLFTTDMIGSRRTIFVTVIQSSITFLNDAPSALSGYFVDPCLLYTSPSPRDRSVSRMPSSA